MNVAITATPAAWTVRVKTPMYEGELPKLVQLIHRREIPIWDLVCSDVTAQIAAQISAQGADVSLDQAGLAVALGAWLPSAKSRAILQRYLPDEAEVAPEEPREIDAPDVEVDPQARAEALALERELIEELAQLVDEQQIDTFRRPGRDEEGQGSDPDEATEARELTIDDLIAELEAVDKTIIAGHRWSVEELMAELRCRAQAGVVLQELAGDDHELLVAAFLALLELVRRREVRAHQLLPFGPLEVAAA